MKRALFVYNPISGSRLVPKNLDRIIENFQKNGIYIDLFRLAEDNEDQLRQALHRRDIDLVVAAGGDGTIGTIAHLIYHENIDLPYGTLGSGTCNNFTHNIDMPEELEKAIQIIAEGDTIEVDMGIVNGEDIFLSSFACGIFVNISFETDSESKQVLGPFAYYMKAISELTNIKAHKVRIDTGQEVIEEKVYLILILNGTNIGNFKKVFSEDVVDISDGMMEMILVKESGPLEMANILMAFMKGESYEELENVDIITSDYFSICSEDEMNVSLDGEKGVPLPVEIKVLKQKLKVFRP